MNIPIAIMIATAWTFERSIFVIMPIRLITKKMPPVRMNAAPIVAC